MRFSGFVSLGASGCGIHPLYGPTASGAEPQRGHEVRGCRHDPEPPRPAPAQRADLRHHRRRGRRRAGLQVGRCAARIDPQHARHATGPATGQVVELDAEYRLVRIKDNEVVFKAWSNSQAPITWSARPVSLARPTATRAPQSTRRTTPPVPWPIRSKRASPPSCPTLKAGLGRRAKRCGGDAAAEGCVLSIGHYPSPCPSPNGRGDAFATGTAALPLPAMGEGWG